MIERLTHRWRREVAEQAAAVAAGTLAPDEAYAAAWWPEDFVARIDGALERYERDVSRLDPAHDSAAWAAVERVVVAINAADSGQIETTTAEELAGYIDDALTDAGVDVEALTRRRGVDRAELTDEWRDW
ncbi:hypothetical protein DMB66_28290 [Actinoplanes sp. ATCC 53533]|uniref:hypothetical protein n=1 Tax=Actinoplanes sp. ATCC 53533 TaxID=1288362 RepID=UPI000F78200F|nr:hypothetical protein [Actinoplanes sp. ATCC 53533]RSM58634.1 hypothetical protein DMB66_28290 [Actinoplanes sp. ATCC 53533]